MEEKIDLILKYFVLQRIKENVMFQMQMEMSERRYDKETPPKLTPLYDNISDAEGLLIKEMAELSGFDFTEIDKQEEEDVRDNGSVQESPNPESNIIISH